MQLEGIKQRVFIRVYGNWCGSDESMGWGVKKRQIKKINLKAMHLLMLLDPLHYNQDSLSIEDGIWCAWWQCGGYDVEWDYEPAFEQLQMYLENHLSQCDFVETGDVECPVKLVYEFSPDLSTAKKVFDLAKQLIERGSA